MANKRRKGGKTGRPSKIIVNTDSFDTSVPIKYIRKCGSCNQNIVNNEEVLQWETMEFCNKACLEKFQNEIGSKCTNCNSTVRPLRLGKLCVRIGYKISQFCNTTCLAKYKAEAKVCAQCQKDVTRDETAIFADVGDGHCKDFCSDGCKSKYLLNANQERLTNSSCTSCIRQKPITYELVHGSKIMLFCTTLCYNAYRYTHNIVANQCKICRKYYENSVLEENSMYYNGETCSFCSPACKNIYINEEKKIVQCKSCKIQKYSFDLIQLNGIKPPVMMCSVKCLSTYQASFPNKSDSSKPTLKSKDSKASKVPLPFVPESITVRDSTPSSTTTTTTTTTESSTSTPVTEIALPLPIKVPPLPPTQRNVMTMCKVKVSTVEASTETKSSKSIGVQKEIKTSSIEIQTDPVPPDFLPIPTPIYVPLPMMMYSAPFPVPFPFPVPLPVPIFIPTTKNTYKGVTKRIKKIVDRSLKDPLQDEMLMLAEMVSKDSKGAAVSSTESESEDEIPTKAPPKRARGGKKVTFGNNVRNRAPRQARFSKDTASDVDLNNYDVDHVASRAPKRAKRVTFDNDIGNDRGRSPRNNRRVMFADDADGTGEMLSRNSNITRQFLSDNDMSDDGISDNDFSSYPDVKDYSTAYREPTKSQNRINDIDGKQDFIKRRKRRQASPGRAATPRKRGRNLNYPTTPITPVLQSALTPASPPPVVAPKPLPPLHELFKKPDNEMHLKYSIGISAWRQWSQTKHPGRFNPDILKLTPEELDTSLCLFVNEVQKPNGQVYAPDTIYYLCLGIQQFLFLNGRTDNIFYNPLYKRFTDCLDEIAKKFLVLYNDSDFIVTRIEEEQLWESKQLGAHSPQVLLSTLLFFNTKYFNLTMVEEHKSLCFSHIQKNAKYCNMKSGRTRTVVLRYNPNGNEPQGQPAKARKKKGYEQYENEENPLRCPIRLYEFYISKCPETVKGSNECFYLLPETSCLPESSVWYSTTAVPDSEVEKVLNRFKIVREVTMALLAK